MPCLFVHHLLLVVVGRDTPKNNPAQLVYLRPTRRALTQAELAERAGVTTATVARIERDEIEPRMTTLRKLAQGLEVDPAELVGE